MGLGNSRNFRRRLKSSVGVAVIATLPMMMGAESEGGCTLLQDTLRSPVQAVTVLKELDDGTVEVDLVLISTEDREDRWITNAQNAELRTPEGDLIPLTMTKDGHYTANSADHPELVYDTSGTNYRVTFEVDDGTAGQAAGSDFIAVLAPPAEELEFEMTKEPEFAGDTAEIQWTPSRLAGLFEVRNEAGDVVFSTFNFDHPRFDGSKWGSLIYGGREQLRVDVFSEPGRYSISFCAVASQEGFDEEVSGGLGIVSGFLAGRCIEEFTLDVPE